MADTLSEAMKVSKLLRQNSLELDYAKYENTKISNGGHRRKDSPTTKGVVNGNKLSATKERVHKILANQDRANKAANQRQENTSSPRHQATTSSSSRKSEDPDRRVAAQFRKTKSETKNKPEPLLVDHHRTHTNRSESRNHDHSKPEPFLVDHHRTHTNRSESRNREHIKPEPLLVDHHKAHTNRSKSRNRDDSKERLKINGVESRNGDQAKSPVKDQPLQEVKRKLKFEDEDESANEVLPQTGLDFTDKIAALRTLIGRDREAKAISDRRAYYDEYKSSHKRIMVSKNDSLKENDGCVEKSDKQHAGMDRKSADMRSKQKVDRDRKRLTEVKSADIFKTRMLQGGRLSAVDVRLLKENLVERRKNNRVTEMNSPIKEERDFSYNNSAVLYDKYATSGDSILHASEDRRIITSSVKNSNVVHKIEADNQTGSRINKDDEFQNSSRPSSRLETRETQNDEFQTSSRPSSRLETRETPTTILNQSIRSVQSNVPFFETSGRISVPVTELEKRRREPAVGREVSKEKKRILCKLQNREGIERGIKLARIEVTSPRQSSQNEGRQTNVDSFVGTSLTPEKERKKQNRLYNDEIDIERLKEKVSKLTDKHYIDEDAEIRRHLEQKYLKTAQGNQRPSSRNRNSVKGGNSDISKSAKRNLKSKDFDGIHNLNTFDNDAVDELFDKDFAKRICLKTDKTDRKVREWIAKQDKGGGDFPMDAGTMLIDELSVNVSLSTERRDNLKVLLNSPSSGSCDKFPVKLAKAEISEKTQIIGSSGFHPMQPNGVHNVEKTRRTISDRLDRISVAVASEKNRLESEIPVRDDGLMGGKRELKIYRQNTESDSLETESSIFSLPFSVQSGESMSSTVQAVKLLRRLYNVDSDTRQDLVLMAKCFRRWLNNVLHAKAHNLQITQAAGRVSPISYGVMLRKGDISYRTSVLTHCFTLWKSALRGMQLHRAVTDLRRKHTLRKGMNAFIWAINRSKLQQGILQDRIHGMLLASMFNKWKCRAIENRRLRLQQTFLRWRQFTKEAQNLDDLPITPIQRIRMLRNQTNMKLKQKIFLEWCDRFQTRLKQNKADFHFRLVLKSHGWLAWRHYTVVTKEKKRRQALAMQMFEGDLQKKMFTYIKVEFAKYTKAKHFHRISQLHVALTAWKVGLTICKTEREDDTRVAVVYWSRTTVKSHFTAWRDSLLTRKACRMSNHIITKQAFNLWNSQYQHLIQRRQAVDSYIRQKVLTNAFRHWCMFVAIMKRRRAAAVECIHSALQRHVLQKWRCYTIYQRDLRKRLQIHVRKQELEKQRKYMSLWRSHFKVKCDIQKAQQFWSNTCAKKAADMWRLVCHKRRLSRLLDDTEPVRQLNTQKVFFIKWRSRLQLIEDEKQEAADVRMSLNLSQLRRCFGKWKYATQQLLLIKPMVLRYRQRLVSQCFTGWREYVQHKAECARSVTMFTKVQLRHKFAAWRRQYLVHQIEKEFNKRLVQGQARRCIQAWHFVIKRKHTAREFHERQVVRTAFYYWNTLAVRQLRQKKLQQVEQETVMTMLREYFDKWRDRLYLQQSSAEERETYLQQEQDKNRVKVMFNFWRRHFRATLVARENEKIRIRRLARQAIQAWHQFTQNSLHDAVEKFAAAIGLHQGAGDNSLNQIYLNGEERYLQEGDMDDNAAMDRSELMFEPMNLDLDPHSSPLTPRTPRTPRQASSCGSPLKRLFSPSLSRQSLAQSLDFDMGAVLTSTSFLDARFEMEHAVKTESRREIVVTAVTRLRHWPISIMFEQWKEYTVRQREFKHLATQMVSVRQQLALTLYFKTWVKYYKEMQLAKQHYEQVLQHKALLSFLLYRNSRKEKKQLKLLANLHYASKVYTHVFPMWLAKSQEKHHKEHIVHLWTNITDAERELIPRERSFRYQLNKKALGTCFSIWFLSYQKRTKLKRAYHKILLERYFGAWCSWALEKHERKVKCDQFREKRIKTLVFKTWCLRHTQKTEVARRYEDAWHNYLGVIVQSWNRWAKDQRKRKLIAAHVVEMRQCHLVTRMFAVWKSSSEQQIRIKKWYEARLMVKVVYAWQSVATWQKDLRGKQLKCQLVSYTILAKRAFRQWHTCYLQRLEQQEKHEQRVQRRVLRIAQTWRKKTQVSRGKLLEKQFKTQQMQSMFNKWRAAYSRNLDRVDQLHVYLTQKHNSIMSHYLDRWRSELMALQAQRVFNMKLVTTLLSNWSLAAKACKQRRQCLAVYQSQSQHHTQKGYFLYWYNVAKARQSIRGHANLKIQLSVFKAWFVYTRKKNNLRRLETAFTRRHNQRILQNNWYLIKTRFDYCVELSEIARGIIQEKNLALMKQALSHWEFRLKIVIADECHEHILAKRVATRWRRFVVQRRQERQHMAELMEKAKKFYHKKLCNKVYVGWYNEVLVTRQVRKWKARLCVKYANVWKRKVDMVYTAKCVRKENLYLGAWKKWHLEFVRRKAIKKVEAFERKQSLTMIFVSWKNLSKKRTRRLSMIPLPVSPAFSMPSASTSTSSTPTEELYSPTQFSRPTQIPLPNMGTTRNKSKLSSSSGATTPTGSSGRTTPTGSSRKPSFGY